MFRIGFDSFLRFLIGFFKLRLDIVLRICFFFDWSEEEWCVRIIGVYFFYSMNLFFFVWGLLLVSFYFVEGYVLVLVGV